MSLIATDRLDAALTEILHQLQRQAAEINNLRGDISERVTRTELQSFERAVGDRMASLERRIEQLEAETALDIPLDMAETLLLADSETKTAESSSSASSSARYVRTRPGEWPVPGLRAMSPAYSYSSLTLHTVHRPHTLHMHHTTRHLVAGLEL